jgi:hypothetical protein
LGKSAGLGVASEFLEVESTVAKREYRFWKWNGAIHQFAVSLLS